MAICVVKKLDCVGVGMCYGYLCLVWGSEYE